MKGFSEQMRQFPQFAIIAAPEQSDLLDIEPPLVDGCGHSHKACWCVKTVKQDIWEFKMSVQNDTYMLESVPDQIPKSKKIPAALFITSFPYVNI